MMGQSQGSGARQLRKFQGLDARAVCKGRRETFRPERKDEGDPRFRNASGQVLHEPKRAGVGPVKVLDGQEQRSLTSSAVEEGAHQLEEPGAAFFFVERV